MNGAINGNQPFLDYINPNALKIYLGGFSARPVPQYTPLLIPCKLQFCEWFLNFNTDMFSSSTPFQILNPFTLALHTASTLRLSATLRRPSCIRIADVCARLVSLIAPHLIYRPMEHKYSMASMSKRRSTPRALLPAAQ